MQWRTQSLAEWHPVPFALWPVCFDSVVYWLEYPPYEQRVKIFHIENVWEYRRAQPSALIAK